jgi:multidrug efflux pump subunit AcrB
MAYMSSISANDGHRRSNATHYDVGYDMDIAAIDVQNYASFASPQMPDDVNATVSPRKNRLTNFIWSSI